MNNGNEPSIKLERNHKDTLFQMAFNDDPEAALSLYNAINESHYTDSSKLTLTLLDGGFFMRMQNDSGFILDHSLNLYEHQSSINENMPLRGLFYFAELYKQIIPEKQRLYQKRLIRIPAPKYVVFYNGTENMEEDKKILRLSDSFEIKDDSHGFEWTATMININHGHNESLMSACKTLRDYALFVDMVRTYTQNMSRHNALIKAINECLDSDVFVKTLTRYSKEIERMEMLREFDEQEYVEFIKEEAREEFMEELDNERQKTNAAIKLLVTTLKSNNISKEEIISTIRTASPSLAAQADTLVDIYY